MGRECELLKRLDCALGDGKRIGLPSQEPIRGVVRFGPIHNHSANTHGHCLFVTDGLSRHELERPTGGPVRQELMVLAEPHRDPFLVASLLAAVADEVAQRHLAVVRGEVFGPHGRIFQDSQLTALFATFPVVVLSDELFMIPALREQALVLVATSTREAEMARAQGPDSFEDYLQSVSEHVSVWGFSRRVSKAMS